ncbi:uncharacterized protein Dmoj_GI23597, isoform B [Drosophila mojavensis]|uniref:Uncharacterized protein, isoform B n=1 Tax=Drosophila mojavensis TaxID=7230 RepID=A0A0Q9X7L8_DROMO|nr:uncharacterized protein Dmoj_GI23597, isoform B [Drosophila mojavensis]
MPSAINMSALRSSAGKCLQLAKNGIRSSSSSSTMSSEARPVLYSYFASSCSWRVRIALGLKNIPYDIRPTNLIKPDETYCYTNEYREINPMQQVPALKIDGQTLCDSVVIMHYLDETRPQNPLLPQDPLKRAKSTWVRKRAWRGRSIGYHEAFVAWRECLPLPLASTVWGTRSPWQIAVLFHRFSMPDDSKSTWMHLPKLWRSIRGWQQMKFFSPAILTVSLTVQPSWPINKL